MSDTSTRSSLRQLIRFRLPRLYEAMSRVRRLPATMVRVRADRREAARYRRCLRTGVPYFGPVMMAGQVNPLRRRFMSESLAAALRGRADRDLRLLEVGSWAGNSAILWADALGTLGLTGQVVCVDPWRPYERSSAQAVPGGMRAPLEDGTIYQLFLHNVAAAGHGGTIKPFRGYSDEVLPALRDQAFVLAYVDGSHAYAQVTRDIENCARLVENGGLLCGDDLELQLHEIDVAFARDMKDHDYVTDPRTGDAYHPGVTLAVAEFFGGPVTCYEGFWAMRKQDGAWLPVQLGSASETLL